MIRSLPLRVLVRSHAGGTSSSYYQCTQGDLAGCLKICLIRHDDVMNTGAGGVEEGVISLVMLFRNEGAER